MKFTKKLTLLLTTVLLFNCSPKKEHVLQLNGTVLNTDIKSILLIKPNQDMRFDSIIEIPVESGKFHYESKLQYPEAVNLYLGEFKKNRGGRFMPLFLENEKIVLTIYSEEEFDKNIVNGGKLNGEYREYKKSLDLKFNKRLQPLQDSISTLGNNHKIISDKMNTFYTELKKVKSQGKKVDIEKQINDLEKEKQLLISKWKILDDKIAIIYSEQKIFQQEYMKNRQTMVSYYFLLNDLISYMPIKRIFHTETIDVNLAKNTFKILAKAYPKHPYNELVSNLIHTIEN
ncbi:MAG: DUF4369 domain-containing protein, partial [Oleispira sp.]|nr:DUF4369 domain-containing protein [Oleispira sp.]